MSETTIILNKENKIVKFHLFFIYVLITLGFVANFGFGIVASIWAFYKAPSIKNTHFSGHSKDIQTLIWVGLCSLVLGRLLFPIYIGYPIYLLGCIGIYICLFERFMELLRNKSL